MTFGGVCVYSFRLSELGAWPDRGRLMGIDESKNVIVCYEKGSFGVFTPFSNVIKITPSWYGWYRTSPTDITFIDSTIVARYGRYSNKCAVFEIK